MGKGTQVQPQDHILYPAPAGIYHGVVIALRVPPIHELARGEGWILVAKPPRVIVHRSRDTRNEYAALQRVRDLVGKWVNPVHRLDRQASGIMLFATDLDRSGELHEVLRAGQKTYVALCRGYFDHTWPIDVDTPLDEKLSRSTVSCLGRCHRPRCSLLRVQPHSGRFHQVRRHVRDLYHPVIGDRDHGDSKVNRWWRERGMGRLALHCLRMTLPFPEGERSVDCPLFEDMHAVVQGLPWWEQAVDQEGALALPPLSIPE